MSKWIMVIITWYAPEVAPTTVHMGFESETACLTSLQSLEERFEEQNDPDFSYILHCKERERIED